MDNNNNSKITIKHFNELGAYRKLSWKPCASHVSASSSAATLFDCCLPTLTLWCRHHFRTPVYCRLQNNFWFLCQHLLITVPVVSMRSSPPIHMMIMILFSISPGWLLHRDWLASLHPDAIASSRAVWQLLQGHHYIATPLPCPALPSISSCFSCRHPDCWVHFSWQQLAVAMPRPVYCCLSDNCHFLLFGSCFIIFANTITPSLTAHWLLRNK